MQLWNRFGNLSISKNKQKNAQRVKKKKYDSKTIYIKVNKINKSI